MACTTTAARVQELAAHDQLGIGGSAGAAYFVHWLVNPRTAGVRRSAVESSLMKLPGGSPGPTYCAAHPLDFRKIHRTRPGFGKAWCLSSAPLASATGQMDDL